MSEQASNPAINTDQTQLFNTEHYDPQVQAERTKRAQSVLEAIPVGAKPAEEIVFNTPLTAKDAQANIDAYTALHADAADLPNSAKLPRNWSDTREEHETKQAEHLTNMKGVIAQRLEANIKIHRTQREQAAWTQKLDNHADKVAERKLAWDVYTGVATKPEPPERQAVIDAYSARQRLLRGSMFMSEAVKAEVAADAAAHADKVLGVSKENTNSDNEVAGTVDTTRLKEQAADAGPTPAEQSRQLTSDALKAFQRGEIPATEEAKAAQARQQELDNLPVPEPDDRIEDLNQLPAPAEETQVKDERDLVDLPPPSAENRYELAPADTTSSRSRPLLRELPLAGATQIHNYLTDQEKSKRRRLVIGLVAGAVATYAVYKGITSLGGEEHVAGHANNAPLPKGSPIPEQVNLKKVPPFDLLPSGKAAPSPEVHNHIVHAKSANEYVAQDYEQQGLHRGFQDMNDAYKAAHAHGALNIVYPDGPSNPDKFYYVTANGNDSKEAVEKVLAQYGGNVQP